MSIRAIVGLGNPGAKYHRTRHNVGFDVIDKIVLATELEYQKKLEFNAEVYESINKTQPLLIKPLTFMNLSGEAVLPIAEKYALAVHEILLVYDCMDLPLGRLRLRLKGSSGGHRGVDSIIRKLESDGFPRLRIGIGRPECETVDHVLSSWNNEEQEIVDQAIEQSVKTVKMLNELSVEQTMNVCNTWRPAENATRKQGD